MTTATAETLQQEYERLCSEQDTLRAQIHETGGATPEQAARRRDITRRIREILAIPPAGYELPKAAAELLAHAELHGWDTAIRWTPPGWEGEVSVDLGVRRQMAEVEQQAIYHQSEVWLYELTYHSRGCAPGNVKRFGAGLCCTPDMKAGERQSAPSLRAIRAVISANPAPGTSPAALF